MLGIKEMYIFKPIHILVCMSIRQYQALMGSHGVRCIHIASPQQSDNGFIILLYYRIFYQLYLYMTNIV